MLSLRQARRASTSTEVAQAPATANSSMTQSTPWTRIPFAVATLRSRASPVSKIPRFASAVTRQKQSFADRARWCALRAKARSTSAGVRSWVIMPWSSRSFHCRSEKSRTSDERTGSGTASRNGRLERNSSSPPLRRSIFAEVDQARSVMDDDTRHWTAGPVICCSTASRDSSRSAAARAGEISSSPTARQTSRLKRRGFSNAANP